MHLDCMKRVPDVTKFHKNVIKAMKLILDTM